MNLSGSLADYFIAFLAGAMVSFTPCVYPLIPISAGYIGINSSNSKLKGLSLGLVYVTGIAITYSLLGILAVITGTIFGKLSSNALIQIISGAIIILFGLSMLDLFVIPFPNIENKFRLIKGNYFSTFFLGIVSGFIISPCLSPVLYSIFAYLSTKSSAVYGAVLLLCFAYGMGFMLILIGLLGGTVFKMLKSNKWMLYFKRAFALIIISIGVYFIYQGIRRI